MSSSFVRCHHVWYSTSKKKNRTTFSVPLQGAFGKVLKHFWEKNNPVESSSNQGFLSSGYKSIYFLHFFLHRKLGVGLKNVGIYPSRNSLLKDAIKLYYGKCTEGRRRIFKLDQQGAKVRKSHTLPCYFSSLPVIEVQCSDYWKTKNNVTRSDDVFPFTWENSSQTVHLWLWIGAFLINNLCQSTDPVLAECTVHCLDKSQGICFGLSPSYLWSKC